MTSSTARTAREIAFIALRHVFIPINAIIFAVVILLIVFGSTREGLFLGSIVLLNILLGFGQDVRAWLLLERLQLLTMPKITRIEPDGTEQDIEVETIRKGDVLALKLGDQAPCDGVVVSSKSLEVNEGLITGESDSFPRGEGDAILAGSAVTSGMGTMRASTSFAESRMAKMARGLKRYSANPSPIQRSIETIIRVTVVVLLTVTLFIIVRGTLIQESTLRIVEQIGALASVLVPQGLVVSATLLFTYGAVHYFNRQVLLQEINATEKFGRVKNLCMDKTGTLTENELTVERLVTPPGVAEAEVLTCAALYVRHSGDSSQTIRALDAFLESVLSGSSVILDALSFSSWRHYGGIAVKDSSGVENVILVGGPEVFMPYLSDAAERSWTADEAAHAARAGKRVLCIARMANAQKVPAKLSGVKLSAMGLFIFDNKLRDGVQNAVNFFQDRGVTIRILSGDHPETVRTVAARAGVKNADRIITGAQMQSWDAADYAKRAKEYALFARIEPEQKERLVEAFKLDGFTAMIGDGANDALSVKKADLGIALFDGAAATRQIAAVVLMRNSFMELPAGVRLADSMIENIEIFASVFMNSTFLQFFLFLSLTVIGFAFPLTPLNITFLNYFTVGFCGLLISFWAINPPQRTSPPSQRPFLERVLPLPLALACIETLGALAVIIGSRLYFPGEPVVSLLIIHLAVTGFTLLALTAETYSGGLARSRNGRVLSLWAFGIIQGLLLYAAFQVPVVLLFFGLSLPSRTGVAMALVLAILASLAMYVVTKIFWPKAVRALAS